MWNFQNNSPWWRAGGRRSGPLWTLQLNIRHYPPLQGVSSRCPLRSVCCRISFCMPLCMNIQAKNLPWCFFVDIRRSQHQHRLIQQDHLQQKKVMPMLHHWPMLHQLCYNSSNLLLWPHINFVKTWFVGLFLICPYLSLFVPIQITTSHNLLQIAFPPLQNTNFSPHGLVFLPPSKGICPCPPNLHPLGNTHQSLTCTWFWLIHHYIRLNRCE